MMLDLNFNLTPSSTSTGSTINPGKPVGVPSCGVGIPLPSTPPPAGDKRAVLLVPHTIDALTGKHVAKITAGPRPGPRSPHPLRHPFFQILRHRAPPVIQPRS